MIKHSTSAVWTPLNHANDIGEDSKPRRMSHSEDSIVAMMEQAKLQIMHLRYRKPTPTFHEQHNHYFAPSLSVASVD